MVNSRRWLLGLMALGVLPGLLAFGCSAFDSVDDVTPGDGGLPEASPDATGVDAGETVEPGCATVIARVEERFDDGSGVLSEEVLRGEASTDVAEGGLLATVGPAESEPARAIRRWIRALPTGTLRGGLLRMKVHLAEPLPNGFAEIGCSLAFFGDGHLTKVSFRLVGSAVSFGDYVATDAEIRSSPASVLADWAGNELSLTNRFTISGDGGSLISDPRVNDVGVERSTPLVGAPRNVVLSCGLDFAEIPAAGAPFSAVVDDVFLELCAD